MKNVLSPISLTKMRPNAAVKPCTGDVAVQALSCQHWAGKAVGTAAQPRGPAPSRTHRLCERVYERLIEPGHERVHRLGREET